MKNVSNGKLLKIFIKESDKFHHKSLHSVILKKIKESNLAAAVVFKGIEGYEFDNIISSAKILRLSEDLPVLIEVMGTSDKILKIIDILEEFNKNDIIMILQDVEIIKFRKSKDN